jgi:hypothetical protein
MYARSNELEERGVINLNAVSIESNPDMEMLLGVSRWSFDRFVRYGALILSLRTEKVHSYALHRLQLLCSCCAQRQGAAIVDQQARSHTFVGLISRPSFLSCVSL